MAVFLCRVSQTAVPINRTSESAAPAYQAGRLPRQNPAQRTRCVTWGDLTTSADVLTGSSAAGSPTGCGSTVRSGILNLGTYVPADSQAALPRGQPTRDSIGRSFSEPRLPRFAQRDRHSCRIPGGA